MTTETTSRLNAVAIALGLVLSALPAVATVLYDSDYDVTGIIDIGDSVIVGKGNGNVTVTITNPPPCGLTNVNLLVIGHTNVNCAVIVAGVGSFLDVNDTSDIRVGFSDGAGPANDNVLNVYDGGVVRARKRILLGWAIPGAFEAFRNRLLISNGGECYCSGDFWIGVNDGGRSNRVLLTSGGLLECSAALRVGTTQTGSVGNTLTNSGGILQFTDGLPTILTYNTPASKGNTIVFTNGVLSYRGIQGGTLPDITDNSGAGGVGDFIWQGTENIFRLNNSIGTNSLGAPYVLSSSLGATNYAGLEMINGSTFMNDVVVSSSGSILFSNTTATIRGTFTNSGTMTVADSTVLFTSNCVLGEGSEIVWSTNALSANVVTVGGTLTLPATLNLDVTGAGLTNGSVLFIAGEISGSPDDWTVLPSSYYVQKTGTSLSIVTIDSDLDGLSDDWELAYFGDLNVTDGNFDQDFDDDGFSDYFELLAGTVPTNPSSRLAFADAIQTQSAQRVLSWYSSDRHSYDVLRTTNLLESFTNIADAVAATEPINVYTDSTAIAESVVFYRLRLAGVNPNRAPVIDAFFETIELQGEAGVEQYVLYCNAMDRDGDTLSYDFEILSGGGTLVGEDAANGRVIYEEDTPGAKAFRCTVADGYGGSVAAELTFTIPTPPPKFYLDQTAWEEAVADEGNTAAYAFVTNDPALPNVLLIGDSISVGYTVYVRTELAGEANVYRIPQNGGSTVTGIAKMTDWLANMSWAVVHYNVGLHDLKYLKDGVLTNPEDGGVRVTAPAQYETNLGQVFDIIMTSGLVDEFVWATTTPVPDGATGRVAGDAVIYNTRADNTLTGYPAVAKDDLWALMDVHRDEQLSANVHYAAAGSQRMATQVAASIRALLPPP